MEAPPRADEFVPGALAALGVEADEIDLAVAEAARELFWPPLVELLNLDLDGLAAERAPDLSRAPEGSGPVAGTGPGAMPTPGVGSGPVLEPERRSASRPGPEPGSAGEPAGGR